MERCFFYGKTPKELKKKKDSFGLKSKLGLGLAVANYYLATLIIMAMEGSYMESKPNMCVSLCVYRARPSIHCGLNKFLSHSESHMGGPNRGRGLD